MTVLSRPKAVIVAYDGSSHAGAALEWAARTAAVEGRTLRAVTVVNVTSAGPHDDEHEARAAFEAAQAETGVTGTFERLAGSTGAILLRESMGAHALVSGTGGHGRVTDAFHRSVSRHLARHSPCPLILVRPQESPTASRIVAGVDGSPESIAALAFACHRASFTNEPVVALHAWNPGHINLDDNGELSRRIGQRSEAAQVLLADCIAGVQERFPDVVIEPDSVPLPPAQALIEASANASLVVTGSGGRGVVAGLLRGSVSQHVLSHARCPVAVTR
ncbi:MAG TPA: universal stress protein [Nocardioides sp.]